MIEEEEKDQGQGGREGTVGRTGRQEEEHGQEPGQRRGQGQEVSF